MTAEDLRVFPIDVAKIDLPEWHKQKSAMFRAQATQVKGISSGRISVKL